MSAAVHGPRVTQADRDAVEDLFEVVFDKGAPTLTLIECHAQAFARHREASQAELVEALEAFQAHVIRHSCTWDDAQNGSHHHPIWQQVAAVLSRARTDATGEGA